MSEFLFELNMLDTLLLLSVVTVAVAILCRVEYISGGVVTLLYLAQLVVVGMMISAGGEFISLLTPQLFGYELGWLLDGLGIYFTLITVGSALLATLYMAGEWGRRYREQGKSFRALQSLLALNVFTMQLLLASSDLLSLFISWELASWAAFALMALSGGKGLKAALHYMIYAFSGAMLVFAVVAWIATTAVTAAYQLDINGAGILQFSSVAELMQQGIFTIPEQLLMLTLLLIGFGIKMGLLPFHLWQAPAYALSIGPAGAFLGAISSRLGLFAIIVVLFKIFGSITDGSILQSSFGFEFASVTPKTLLAWIAVATIIFPTFVAMRQNDARHLLAWHGIGQGGYMLLGLVMMDSLGSAGGLLHVFNHATYQAALFLAVTSVIYRTGTADLNRLGGLVVRMPLSFMTLLIGIIGLAGLPPMNGFVSKWLVYRSLLDQGELLLFVGAVIGTLGTILSVYKLIHNMFLGSLRKEHEEVREVSWSMLTPMLILSALILLTGLFPGIPLQWVAQGLSAVGLPVAEFNLGGVMADGGSLDMVIVSMVLFSGFGVAALIFYFVGGKSKRVNPLDNYAGGHFLYASNRYHYSNNFYAGLMHLIKPWYKNTFQRLERVVVTLLELTAESLSRLYMRPHSNQLALIIVVLLLW